MSAWTSRARASAGRHEEFEGGEQVGAGAPREVEGGQRRVEAGHGDEGGGGRGRAGHEAEGGGGDDAEGALGADEELFEVGAGVVLAERREAVPEGAVGEHDLEPEDLVAHHAVAQHVDAAGVGGDDAADLGRALAADGEWQEEIVFGDRVLDGLERAAGVDGGGIVVGVDGADAVHAGEAEAHLGVASVGQGAVDEAGIAALRHDRETEAGAGADHRLDLGRVARAQDRERAAGAVAEPGGEVRGHRVRVGQDGVAERAGQRVDRLAHGVSLPAVFCGQW